MELFVLSVVGTTTGMNGHLFISSQEMWHWSHSYIFKEAVLGSCQYAGGTQLVNYDLGFMAGRMGEYSKSKLLGDNVAENGKHSKLCDLRVLPVLCLTSGDQN